MLKMVVAGQKLIGGPVRPEQLLCVSHAFIYALIVYRRFLDLLHNCNWALSDRLTGVKWVGFTAGVIAHRVCPAMGRSPKNKILNSRFSEMLELRCVPISNVFMWSDFFRINDTFTEAFF
jgi:hypothetical protein